MKKIRKIKILLVIVATYLFLMNHFFYREVDNSIEIAVSNVDKNCIKNLNLTDDNYHEWLINPDALVENYTPCSLINPGYDNFKNEEAKISKFDSVCYTTGKKSKDSFLTQ